MFHVITGPPCAGKTTYAEQHAKAGDIIVDFDKIARALNSQTSHLPPSQYVDVTCSAREAVIRKCAEKDYNAWIIHTTIPKQFEELYTEADFIKLDTDMETCLARASEDNRPEGTEDIILDYFTRKEKTMQFKQFSAQLKEDSGEARIIAYAATFDREPDSYGDVIKKGAFEKSLAKLAEKGEKLPLLFGHRTDDPMMNIGIVEKAEEDDKGLLVEALIDTENENGAYAYKLLKEGRLKKLSFAYDVLDRGEVEIDGFKANELRELDIFEVSLVPIPANQHAEVVEIKQYQEIAQLKADVAELKDGLSQLKASGVNTDVNAQAEEQKVEEQNEREELLKQIESILTKE